MVNFNCELSEFATGIKNEFKCFDPENSTTYLLIFNKNKDNDHYRSLLECNVNSVYSDLTRDNTLYIEMLQGGKNPATNENLRGMGKKLMRILLKTIEKLNTDYAKNYKYMFLYPSANLGGRRDQEGLIKIYESYGFRRFGPCPYYSDGLTLAEMGISVEEGEHPFDAPGKTYLMVANYDELNERIEKLGIDDTVNYLQKYLKYKKKYLSLKKLNKN